MGASADSQTPGIHSGGWMTGLLGRNPLTRGRGVAVCERLDVFVAPVLEEEEPEDLSDVDWVRLHNAKVRDSVKGSADLTRRLSGEDDEIKPAPLPPRAIKGEALMAKILEQRLRRNSPA